MILDQQRAETKVNETLGWFVNNYENNTFDDFIKDTWEFCSENGHSRSLNTDSAKMLYLSSRSEIFNYYESFCLCLFKMRSLLTETYAIKLEAFKDLFSKLASNIYAFLDTHDPMYTIEMNKFMNLYQYIGDYFIHARERKEKFDLGYKMPFYMAVPRHDETFVVSKGNLKDYLIWFDFWTDKNEDAECLVEYYANLMNGNNRNSFTHICLVNKELGPRGPRGLEDIFKEKFPDKKIIRYNQKSFNGSPFEGIDEQENQPIKANICYDLFDTGKGLRNCEDDLYKGYCGQVIKNVVLYQYPEPEYDIEVKKKTKAIFENVPEEKLKRKTKETQHFYINATKEESDMENEQGDGESDNSIDNAVINEFIKQMFLRVVENWIDSSEADEPIVYTSEGEAYTPRKIYELVKNNTEEGKEFAQSYLYGIIDYHLYSLQRESSK